MELLLFIAIVAVTAVVGVRIGILASSRVERVADRFGNPGDDGEEGTTPDGN